MIEDSRQQYLPFLRHFLHGSKIDWTAFIALSIFGIDACISLWNLLIVAWKRVCGSFDPPGQNPDVKNITNRDNINISSCYQRSLNIKIELLSKWNILMLILFILSWFSNHDNGWFCNTTKFGLRISSTPFCKQQWNLPTSFEFYWSSSKSKGAHMRWSTQQILAHRVVMHHWTRSYEALTSTSRPWLLTRPQMVNILIKSRNSISSFPSGSLVFIFLPHNLVSTTELSEPFDFFSELHLSYSHFCFLISKHTQSWDGNCRARIFKIPEDVWSIKPPSSSKTVTMEEVQHHHPAVHHIDHAVNSNISSDRCFNSKLS